MKFTTVEEFNTHLKSMILPLIKEAGDSTIKEAVEQAVRLSYEKMRAEAPWMQALKDATTAAATTTRKREKGEAAGRILRAIVLAKGNTNLAASVLKEWGDVDLSESFAAVNKAPMAASIPSSGGTLIPEQFSSDVIELLRPMSVVRDMVGSTLPMPTGTLNIPRISSGSSGYYGNENQNITPSSVGTGQLTLTWKKLTALVPMSNDLLRYSSPAADGIVRTDMVRAIAQRENQAFLRDNGTGAAPKGLRYWAANAGNPIIANPTVNLANVTVDLGKCILQLLNNNVPMSRPGWIFAPRTYVYLMTVRDGNGNFAFRSEMMTGRLWGWPYRYTTQMPINLTDHGGSAESEVYFADFDDVVIGEAAALRVDASDVAAYWDGSAVVAAFSQDQTVVRAITEHDFAVRRPESVAIMNGVNWQ